ncbi:MAG: MoxR family ATPase, partial [bacterium]
AAEELDIAKRVTGTYQARLEPVLSGDDILKLQEIVRRVPAADHVFEYARDVARATRPGPDSPAFIRELVQWGAGPRATINMMMAAKARAILHGRYHATTEDVRALAVSILRHRIVPTFNADASGITTDQIIHRLLDEVKPAAADSLT